MRLAVLIGLAGAVLASCSESEPPEPNPPIAVVGPCRVGIYGHAEQFLTVTQRDETYRYAISDGRIGQITDNPDVDCRADRVITEDGATWPRLRITVTDTEFDADGVTLAGQLLEPEDASPGTTLVVLAHGSEELGWIEAVSYPYQLVGRGVSVFVYDKRGTGRSNGTYSQNFPQLADDLVAASAEAKRLAEDRFGRFGLFGFSQGGWIAPMAAGRSGADFIGIGYGLVIDILEEDAAQVQLELREADYGEDIVALGREVTDVTARLAVSQYSDGLDDLDALRDQYGDEEWFQNIRGGFSGVILSLSSDELRTNGVPMFDRLNIDWSVKPMDVLRGVDVPQLWVLAENDREAPIAATFERLQVLRGEGKDISVFEFPGTDHGMWEFEQAQDGTRTYTRVTDRYYDLLADWAEGELSPPYSMSTEK